MSLLLGIDLGTSFIKVSVVHTATGSCLCSVQYPEKETEIISKEPGWAEQLPLIWWQNICEAILLANASGKYNPRDISAIGIAYQMHGLIIVDKEQHVLRRAIIWCDSRATDRNLYPFGNFTAGKLAWVKNNEPEIYSQIDKILLPGDYISMKLTGEVTTTPSALSEGMFWNLKENGLNISVFTFHGFDYSLIPAIKPVFASHGGLKEEVASMLNLQSGIPVSYKAGDQLNNAFALRVLAPGEIAAAAGTSGVIYAITENDFEDEQQRVNAFVHVNHDPDHRRFGVLLCINGCGSANSWIKKNMAASHTYQEMNDAAASVEPGCEDLRFFPFGNGAERMLKNKTPGAEMVGLDFNRHGPAHIYRAVQEGIAFAFRYGLDVMRENGIRPTMIRAGLSNMFLSEVFTDIFSAVTNTPVELYETNGAIGAAIGAGIGAGLLTYENAFGNVKPVKKIEPDNQEIYNQYYQSWKQLLVSRI